MGVDWGYQRGYQEKNVILTEYKAHAPVNACFVRA